MKPFTYDLEENLRLEKKLNAEELPNYAKEFGKDPEKTRLLCMTAVRIFAAVASNNPIAGLLVSILPSMAPVVTGTLIDVVFSLEKELLDMAKKLKVNPGYMLLAAIFAAAGSEFPGEVEDAPSLQTTYYH